MTSQGGTTLPGQEGKPLICPQIRSPSMKVTPPLTPLTTEESAVQKTNNCLNQLNQHNI